ncbi:sigma-70 family RNA polymerase sigma factor [Rhodococcus spelaei]|uniref:Sigma-70 family RNA polymerase sigma factor n=1 Tax=Rhodococcus spelaei TaxID=2546320 RepID=A0A541BPE2_9NOCA|nr:sigma-70 family RNA polymerase sigma factor [Rhodococcus spelaei]TQF74196.1 sigma-70 family RNA polymerase sigma factor [Rhodococcus spelaei]
MAVAELTESFESHRSHLLAVGYRLTGSVADAEDAVQEAWLRLSETDAGAIRDLRGWLTTVVGRICLDHLRSAAVRRESYVGQWLPEPIVTPLGSLAPADPLDEVVRSEDSRLAAMIVLDTLGADQRTAFVLHDGFGVPFDEIAGVLGTSVASSRQLASRARRTVAGAHPPAPDPGHDEAVGRLMTAMSSGDLQAVLDALHPDAVVVGDANGTTRTAVNVIHGADKFARFFLGLLNRYGAQALQSAEPVLVNGELGIFTHGCAGDATHPGFPSRVGGFAVRDGKVCAAYDIANPDKLSGVRLPDRPLPGLPTAPGTRHRS